MNRLLVVHDDALARARIVRAARTAGFAKDCISDVKSGKETRALFADPFLIAVIDINLLHDFDESGVELVRELRKSQPDCKVIAVSKGVTVDPFVHMLDAGAHDFVSEKWAVDFDDLLTQRLQIWKKAAEVARDFAAEV